MLHDHLINNHKFTVFVISSMIPILVFRNFIAWIFITITKVIWVWITSQYKGRLLQSVDPTQRKYVEFPTLDKITILIIEVHIVSERDKYKIF